MARRGREPLPPTRSTHAVRVTVRLDATTYELAQQAARAAGLSLSAYAARALRAQAEADTSREPAGPGEPPTPPAAATVGRRRSTAAPCCAER